MPSQNQGKVQNMENYLQKLSTVPYRIRCELTNPCRTTQTLGSFVWSHFETRDFVLHLLLSARAKSIQLTESLDADE